MAAHKYYETMKGKDGIGIQYVYHVGKKGKRIRNRSSLMKSLLFAIQFNEMIIKPRSVQLSNLFLR